MSLEPDQGTINISIPFTRQHQQDFQKIEKMCPLGGPQVHILRAFQITSIALEAWSDGHIPCLTWGTNHSKHYYPEGVRCRDVQPFGIQNIRLNRVNTDDLNEIVRLLSVDTYDDVMFSAGLYYIDVMAHIIRYRSRFVIRSPTGDDPLLYI